MRGKRPTRKSRRVQFLLVDDDVRDQAAGTQLAEFSRRECSRSGGGCSLYPCALLDARYTVEQSIAEPMVVHRVGRNALRRDRLPQWLDQVALPTEMSKRPPHELSGGQRQRVAIARALALSPNLVVLDEAASALVALAQPQVLDLLADLQSELGLSYPFISHDLPVMRMIFDQVEVMQPGRIVESCSPEQTFDNPQDEYTQELLAAIPGGSLLLDPRESGPSPNGRQRTTAAARRA